LLEEARNAALELPLPTTEEAFDKGVSEEQADEIRAIVALFRFRIISDTLLEVPLVKTFLDGPDTVARDHLRRRSFLPRPFARIRGKVCVPRSGGLRSASMRVEVLYFDGCPTYLEAEKTLRDVLSQEDAEVELVVVNTDEEARKLRFPGSPTIRVDGEDLFPVPERKEYALGCRMYATPEGLKGSPTVKMLKEALANFRERLQAKFAESPFHALR
jgi:hypothetical protein